MIIILRSIGLVSRAVTCRHLFTFSWIKGNKGKTENLTIVQSQSTELEIRKLNLSCTAWEDPRLNQHSLESIPIPAYYDLDETELKEEPLRRYIHR